MSGFFLVKSVKLQNLHYVIFKQSIVFTVEKFPPPGAQFQLYTYMFITRLLCFGFHQEGPVVTIYSVQGCFYV